MNDEELQALCDTWKNKLRLGDWDIRCSFAHINEMSDLYNNAKSNYNKTHRTAIVKIVYPGESKYDFPDFGEDSIEYLVVHELVHILLADCVPAEVSDHEEWAVIRLSRALTS